MKTQKVGRLQPGATNGFRPPRPAPCSALAKASLPKTQKETPMNAMNAGYASVTECYGPNICRLIKSDQDLLKTHHKNVYKIVRAS